MVENQYQFAVNIILVTYKPLGFICDITPSYKDIQLNFYKILQMLYYYRESEF